MIDPPTKAHPAERGRLKPTDHAAHRWYRFVLSFPPHLVRQYVERFELTPADTVLDPFCGTGTTLVECKKLGLRSVGIERNPVAAFASEVKVSWGVDPDRLLEHATLVASTTEEKLADEGLSECGDLPLFRPATDPALLRALPPNTAALLLKGSISPAPLHRTLALLETISELRDDRFVRHELLALAKGLVSGISNLEFGPEVGVGRPKKDAPVTEIWMQAVHEIAEDIRSLQGLDALDASVHLGDSRYPASIVAPSSIDAVITSPPYPNEKDYTRTTRLELVLLNFIRSKDDLRALKRGLVRSNTHGIYRDDSDDSLIAGNTQVEALAQAIEARRIELGKTSGFERMYPRVTKLYFGGMARHLLEMRRILRPGAHLAYVVGDQASYLRVMIRTGQVLAEIASSAGYEVLGIDLFRTRLSTATREHLREEVLLLRWPASGSHQNSMCNKEATVSSVLPRMERNTLYYGDNLDVLRRHVPSESVDLVYLDPPFKSNQDYNILFAEQDGSRSAAQIKAFEDTWRWDRAAVESYLEVVERGGKVGEAMQGFRKLLGDNDMLAYLAMMAPRLVELHRTMKPTGSIYLHCDPTASHYLKLMMDAVFDARNFRSEIIWRRTGTHGKAKRYAPIHDTVLFYVKSNAYKWNHPKRPYMKGHVEEYFVRDDRGWRTAYYGNVLTGSGLRKGESGAPWRGFDPSRKGRHWAIPGAVIEDIDEDLSGFSQHEKLDRLFELGYIKIVDGQAWPVYEHYLAPQDGQAVSDIWANQPYTSGTVFGSDAGIDEDVKWLSPRDQERLGYPTQKPEGLLDRIIRASSDEDDVVLDPFSGCGTAIAVANRLNRRWIGIDITHLAITLIKHRFLSQGTSAPYYQVIGEPVSLPDAEALARQDPHQFQWWALGIVGARPAEQKRGADKGIDGRLYFHHNGKSPKTSQIIFSVKSGNTSVRDVRDLRGVIEREQAELGVLITLRSPTGPMRREAAGAGLYHDEWSGEKYNRMQIITIRELLEGRQVQYPRYLGNTTFRRAGKQKRDRKARSLPLIRK